METPRSYYETKISSCAAEVSQLDASRQNASRLRIVVVAVWVLLLFLAWNAILPTTVAWVLAAVAFVALIIFAGWEARLTHQIAVTNARADVAKCQLARMDRNWADVPEFDVSAPTEVSQVSADLDLFGRASLYQLLCRAHTPRGRELLRDWLAFGAEPDVVGRRNEAAEALAPMRDFRERLDLRGRLLGTSQTGPAAFIEWAEGDRWLEKRSWLTLASRALVVVTVLTFALAILGVMPTAMFITLGVALLLNLILSVLWSGRVHEIFEQVDSRQNDVVHYRELLDLFASLPHEPALLTELRAKMGDDTSLPQQALSKLAGIMQFARMRHSGLLGIVHLLLQLWFLIDFHVLGFLENWHREYGPKVSGWFEAVGELEALASLASLLHDHPDWNFANYATSHDKLAATSLGHPLLASPVCNDVELGPAGTFLLVTGSNMSGKSTLLRTIGLNCVLAQAGGPVRSNSLELPPVEIATSMRIQDSLEDGVSFFMAELQRLKEIVDLSQEVTRDGKRTMLFLLDEILQGTNSAERHIAVTQVVQQLTAAGAMGAISTHDLELANNAELNEISTPVHFRETITDSDGMTFDYQMRQGVATTTNALKLLELVGIRR